MKIGAVGMRKLLRATLRGPLYGVLLYLGIYAGARATHQLVRNQDGCVSRPWGFFDRVRSCEELELIDRARGRTVWQVAFRPLILLEERLRGPAAPDGSSSSAP